MTSSARIVLNVAATYGRSLLSLACGLFSARWVLMALGHEDYGLFGVVGGLTGFIALVNILFGGAISRYYACSIGEAGRLDFMNDGRGLENCRAWFNTALSVHTIVPIFLMAVGYPIGEWIVRNFLVIPAEKVDTCVFVFRLSCLTCFMGMVNVPFSAMYTAKQYIAELTIYSAMQTVANTFFFYYMASHPGEWLSRYAVWMCFIAVVPYIIISWRAFVVFPECRINFAYWWDKERLKSLSSYAGWQMFGGLGYMFRTQGMAILVNKYFGAGVNAAMSVASQASAQTQTLVVAVSGAFQPAIATAYGAGDYEKMRSLSYQTCKYALSISLIFMIPLALELQEVLVLWLKNPPPCAVGLCWAMMVMLLIDKATTGQNLACNASGKIAGYQKWGGGALILCLPLAWLFLSLGFNVYFVGVAMILGVLGHSVSLVYFARRVAKMPVLPWLKFIILPISGATLLGCLPGSLVVMMMPPSFARVVVTTLLVEGVFLPLLWLFVLDKRERSVVSGKMQHVLMRFR